LTGSPVNWFRLCGRHETGGNSRPRFHISVGTVPPSRAKEEHRTWPTWPPRFPFEYTFLRDVQGRLPALTLDNRSPQHSSPESWGSPKARRFGSPFTLRSKTFRYFSYTKRKVFLFFFSAPTTWAALMIADTVPSPSGRDLFIIFLFPSTKTKSQARSEHFDEGGPDTSPGQTRMFFSLN